jgi:hypothetical protein
MSDAPGRCIIGAGFLLRRLFPFPSGRARNCAGRLLPAPHVAVIALVLALAHATPHAQRTVLESRLKAAFIAKFPQFVEWPAAAFDGRTTLDVCVAAPDPFGPDLFELVAEETLNGRPIVARRIDRDLEIDGCQVLFLPDRSGSFGARLLERAASLPILTVGDDPRFLDQGGIVAFRLVGGRVRFEVNLAAAQRVGLRVSSQLLSLAISVRSHQ